MGNIRLKIKAISPIHIGSGEIYEPTNFVIDGGVLYEFRDEDFFLALPEIKQKAFMQILTDNKSDSFIKIHNFVKNNIQVAKDIAYSMVKVSDGLQKEYEKVVGKVRQLEGKGRAVDRVFNKFEIQRIQRKQVKTLDNSYAHTGYIVGSSLKGAISTAYQEFIYKKEGEQALKKKFQAKGREISNNLFKEFKVSDSFVKEVSTKIGFALNKERFEYDKYNPRANIKLSTQIEAIMPNSEFFIDINYGTLNIKEILQSCNDHYMPIFKSIMQGKNEYINNYLDKKFYDDYLYWEPKPNQYLIRVGKHSGARAVTIEGLRDIKSKLSGGGKKRKPNRFEQRKDETTTWLFGDNPNSNNNLLPFGWLICEITDETPNGLEAIDRLYLKKVEERNLSKKEQIKREKAKEEEERKRAEEEAKQKAKLASMTPAQRLIEEYSDIAVLINDMKSGKIENFEEIKIELAQEIKKILQQNPKTWDKAKKKALDRRNYIEGLLK